MGRKFTIFALFYFVFEGKFQVQAPRGRLIFGAGAIEQRVFCVNDFAGAYIWRGLYMEELICGILRYFQTEGGCVPVSFSCDEQHESRRVREKKPKFKKSSSLVLVGQTIYSHSKTRKFILKQCRQCVQQSIHLLINFQVFK